MWEARTWRSQTAKIEHGEGYLSLPILRPVVYDSPSIQDRRDVSLQVGTVCV